MVNRLEEDKILQRARQGDRNAFAELVKMYGDRIYGLALRMTGNEKDAEDVYQDTFLMALRKLDQFKGESSFFTWVYRIAINMAISKIKQRKKNFSENGLEDPDFDRLHQEPQKSWPDIELTQVDRERFRKKLSKALEKLPEIYRTVFILRDMHGLSTEETARILEITPSNTKIRLMRARNFLKNELESFLKEEGILL